ncbi:MULTISPECIES: hypothetical protein [Roseomonadaceae]|uniref:Lipoprotein n=1 Tax=Falsiroseomonas oleicola TaxID=2801474 RepID=A0ABS6H8R3_9PROT|nr:hypothetical protein [Roseomonas oleicola]MBU8545109.1 hypothetical protein [Roseomonas oleicola]
MTERSLEHPPLTRLAVLPLLAALAACSSASPVTELAPETYGLTTHASTAAQAARIGVEQARAHCTAMGRNFAVTRSEIGGNEYTIAFTCPRPNPNPLMVEQAPPAPVLVEPAGPIATGALPPMPAPTGRNLY